MDQEEAKIFPFVSYETVEPALPETPEQCRVRRERHLDTVLNRLHGLVAEIPDVELRGRMEGSIHAAVNVAFSLGQVSPAPEEGELS